MLEKLDNPDSREAADWVPPKGPQDSSTRETLTIFERQILKLMADGKSSQEVSKLLGLTVRTLYDYHIEIMDKLNFRNPFELLKYVINEGYSYKEI